MGLIPDISHYHPVKGWGLVKANCPFLISKATQGLTYVDPTLQFFISGCEKLGIPYWLYVFLNKGNERAQVEYMVKVCKDKVGKYFVGYILDVEKGNAATDVKKAMDYLQSLGGKYMVYTMYAQHDTYKAIMEARPANCAWWEARYGRNDGY